MEFPVYAGILVKSGGQSNRIAEPHAKDLGLQRLMPEVITGLYQRQNPRYPEYYPEKRNQQLMDGLGLEQEKQGTNQVPVHSIFACKDKQISNVRA